MNTNTTTAAQFNSHTGLISTDCDRAVKNLTSHPLMGTISAPETGFKFTAFEDRVIIHTPDDKVIGSFYSVWPATHINLVTEHQDLKELLSDYLLDLSKGNAPRLRPTYPEAADLFEQVVLATDEVAFNAEWANTTGYFDHAVSENSHIAHPAGNGAHFTDPHGRRGIILWDALLGKTFVVFERFAPGGKGQLLVYNADSRTGRSSGLLTDSGYLAHQLREYLTLASVKERLAKKLAE